MPDDIHRMSSGLYSSFYRPETRGRRPVCVTSEMKGEYVPRDIPRGMVGGEKKEREHEEVLGKQQYRMYCWGVLKEK